jgi:hypothetical protein
MRRFLPCTYIVFVALLLSACSGLSEPSMGPVAEPAVGSAAFASAADEHRAGVFIDLAGFCGMFDGNGNLVGPLDPQVNVITQSPNGNALHNCFATVDNPTGRAIRYTSENNPLGIPLGCTIFDNEGNFIVTFKVHEQISASGKAHLICVATGAR